MTIRTITKNSTGNRRAEGRPRIVPKVTSGRFKPRQELPYAARTAMAPKRSERIGSRDTDSYFAASGADQLKLLHWAVYGFVQPSTWLEEGSFRVPVIDDEQVSTTISAADLAMRLADFGLVSMHRDNRATDRLRADSIESNDGCMPK